MKIKTSKGTVRIDGVAGVVVYNGYTFSQAVADYLNRILTLKA